MLISNCEFVNNSAANGGAIASGSDLLILDSTFENNTASGKGSSIYSQSDVVIEKSEFKNNDAVYGTALRVGHCTDHPWRDRKEKCP